MPVKALKKMWFRLAGSEVWHRGRLYYEGITVFDCVGYRESTYVDQEAVERPKGSRKCRRCPRESND